MARQEHLKSQPAIAAARLAQGRLLERAAALQLLDLGQLPPLMAGRMRP